MTPIEHYEFQCIDSWASTFAPKVAASFLGSLITNNSSLFFCHSSGVGVKSSSPETTPLLESANDIVSFQQHFISKGASGLSFEAWITPYNLQKPKLQPIITIGQRTNKSRNHPDAEPLGCNGLEFCLALNGKHFELIYADGDSSRSCRRLGVATELVASNMTHVVVSFTNETTRVFINGKAMFGVGVNNFFDTHLRIWNPSYSLKLFSSSSLELGGIGAFSGMIHNLAIYDSIIQKEDVLSSFKRGMDRADLLLHKPTRLLARPSKSYSLEQGQTKEDLILIGGTNVSTMEWTLAVQLLSVPRHGKLFSSNGTRLLSRGSVLMLGYNDSQTPVCYASFSKDYFNAPNITATGDGLTLSPDIFQYRIIALNSTTDEILRNSSPVTQLIRVINVNDKPALTAPSRVSYDSVSSDVLGISGILLVDRDMNVDSIRVDLFARNGSLSLNTAYRHLADFQTCRARIPSSWQCHGRGVNDRSMTFLALPDDVNLVLKELKYSSFFKEAFDEVVVRVYDGAEENCLGPTELPHYLDEDGNFYSTIRKDCFEVEVMIQIEPSTSGSENQIHPVYMHFLLIWISLGLILSSVSCGLNCCCQFFSVRILTC